MDSTGRADAAGHSRAACWSSAAATSVSKSAPSTPHSGRRIVVVEFTDGLLPTADRDLVKPVEDRLRKRFEAIHLNTKVASLQPTDKGIVATLEGKDVPAEETFDRVLVSVGRRPNSAGLGLDKAGVNVTDRGYIPVDKQRRTNIQNIYALGDVAEEPGLAHKATAEAKVAVEAILGESAAFEPRAIPAVVFTDPEIAWAGLTEREATEKDIRFEKFVFPLGGIRPRDDARAQRRSDQAARRSGDATRARHRHRRRRRRRDDLRGRAGDRNGRCRSRRRRQHSPASDAVGDNHGRGGTGVWQRHAHSETAQGAKVTKPCVLATSSSPASRLCAGRSCERH